MNTVKFMTKVEVPSGKYCFNEQDCMFLNNENDSCTLFNEYMKFDWILLNNTKCEQCLKASGETV